MLTTRATQALIDLEDDSPDFLFTKLPGTDIPIWPHIRYSFAAAASESELNVVEVSRKASAVGPLWRLVRSFVPNTWDSRSIRHRGDVLFMVGGTTIRHVSGGRENWLVDTFARTEGVSSVIVQQRPLQVRRDSKPLFTDTYSFDPSVLRVEVARRLSPLSSSAREAVESVVRMAARGFGYELSESAVEAIVLLAVSDLARARHLRAQHARLLDTVQPRVVFMENASYGGSAAAIRLMKDRGIVVIEPQHGWIGPSHAAYNFGAAMSTPVLSKSLPDVLMTFGEFWSSNVRYPGEVVAIGKPHLDLMSQHVPPLADRAHELLIVSSVAEPGETAALVLTLRDLLPEPWRLVFRSHPSEHNELTARYPSLVDADRVSFDSNSDVYDTLRRVRGVLGYASTVLYEALAMGCQVFVKNSPFAPYYMAEFFGNPVEGRAGMMRLVASLLDPDARPTSTAIRNSIWKPDAAANFRDYLSTLL